MYPAETQEVDKLEELELEDALVSAKNTINSLRDELDFTRKENEKLHKELREKKEFIRKAAGRLQEITLPMPLR